mmetsp:Transcript_14612/g.25493  ORF Transcript_14612/g.25493 Transcript_14612/m.25493 type:complete len:185 (-) Transcript_14612:925-1479(-)
MQYAVCHQLRTMSEAELGSTAERFKLDMFGAMAPDGGRRDEPEGGRVGSSALEELDLTIWVGHTCVPGMSNGSVAASGSCILQATLLLIKPAGIDSFSPKPAARRAGAEIRAPSISSPRVYPAWRRVHGLLTPHTFSSPAVNPAVRNACTPRTPDTRSADSGPDPGHDSSSPGKIPASRRLPRL